MCIIEHKTYIDSDGERTYESVKPCWRATGTHLCELVTHRSIGPIRLVEAKPRIEERSPKPRKEDSPSKVTKEERSSDNRIITETSNGRRIVYRDPSKRSSIGSSIPGSATMSERSPPSSRSSPSSIPTKPKAPTPPSPGSLFAERLRSPYPPPPVPDAPTLPPDPSRRVTAEGTAIYDRPPSLDLPRAEVNERPPRPDLNTKESISSMTAEVDDIEPKPSKRASRPNISIDTSARPSSRSGASMPRAGILRTSSRRDSKMPDTSRRREKASPPLEEAMDDPLESAVAAEMEQMSRERAAAAQRRESDASRYSWDGGASPTSTRRESPTATRRDAGRSYGGVTIHQRGEDIIAREQARDASRRLDRIMSGEESRYRDDDDVEGVRYEERYDDRREGQRRRARKHK